MSIVISRHDQTLRTDWNVSPDVILRDGPDILVPLVSVAQILMCMNEFHASEICFYLDVSVNTARKG